MFFAWSRVCGCVRTVHRQRRPPGARVLRVLCILQRPIRPPRSAGIHCFGRETSGRRCLRPMPGLFDLLDGRVFRCFGAPSFDIRQGSCRSSPLGVRRRALAHGPLGFNGIRTVGTPRSCREPNPHCRPADLRPPAERLASPLPSRAVTAVSRSHFRLFLPVTGPPESAGGLNK